MMHFSRESSAVLAPHALAQDLLPEPSPCLLPVEAVVMLDVLAMAILLLVQGTVAAIDLLAASLGQTICLYRRRHIPTLGYSPD
jgi:hypothetical protein